MSDNEDLTLKAASQDDDDPSLLDKAKAVAKGAAKTLGHVVETVGDKIEDATDAIGKALGADPNDAVASGGGTSSGDGSGGSGSGGSGGTGSGGSGGTGSGGSGGSGTGGTGGSGSTGGTGGAGGSPTTSGGTSMSDYPIQFRDIAEREAAAAAAPAGAVSVFKLFSGDAGTTSTTTTTELKDPLFRAVSEFLDRVGFDRVQHHEGRFPKGTLTSISEDESAAAALMGLMMADNVTRPELESFAGALTTALTEYTTHLELFRAVLRPLALEGLTTMAGTQVCVVRAEHWATVVRLLRQDRIRADDPQLGLKVRAALANQVVTPETALPSSIDIKLPDLETQVDVEIVADNIRATQAIHYAAMLEEWRFFQVADKLVELFQHGLLPLGRGRAGDRLYGYWKKSVNRITEYERRTIFARTFGLPGGDPGVQNPNGEFHNLFLRFIAAVSSYVRQQTVDSLLRAGVPHRVSAEHVRKAGRDLAANLSLHGYGMAHFAATELQGQIRDVLDILNEPEIRAAYGARDFAQVIDQVSALELGGARNGVRYRTMATSGAVIIRWLAENSARLSSFGSSFLSDTGGGLGRNPLEDPSDAQLVEAVEAYLAVTGTPEDRVEEYAQPSEGPVQTSRPIAIPQAARDLLESVGVSAGYGGNGGGYGASSPRRW